MKSIAYFNTIDYGFALKQRPHHLMDIFSNRGYQVYWVDKTSNKEFIRQRVNNNFTLYSSWDIFKKRVPEIDIAFTSWSHKHKELDELNYKIHIYDSLDNFEENSSDEHLMLQKTDILLTTSQPLYDLRSHEHNNIHMCRNACFPELGNINYKIPMEYLSLNRPILLFSGALSATWCDIELVEKLAKEFTVVVVGIGWGLKNVPKGIKYLGKKTYHQLQAYYHHCDVNILPFRRCQVSDYSNPIKNYEAMSHGKLTVATDIPEATIYPDAVYASKNHVEFIENVYKALKVKDDKNIISRCKEIASENSWCSRVDVIEKAIDEYATKNNISF